MKKALFLAFVLSLAAPQLASAWFRVPPRTFVGSGGFEFWSVASNRSMAMVGLGQGVLWNRPDVIDTAIREGAVVNEKIYFRFDSNECPITRELVSGECYVDAITVAIYLDRVEAAIRLIDLGAASAEAVLKSASDSKSVHIVTALTAKGVRYPGSLYNAVRSNDLSLVIHLLKNGADPFYQFNDLLFAAAYTRSYEVFVTLVNGAKAWAAAHQMSWDIKKYIDSSVSMNNIIVRSSTYLDISLTPLNVAVTYNHGNPDLVKYLVENGAKVHPDLLKATDIGGGCYENIGARENPETWNYLVSLGLKCPKQ